MSHFRKFTDSDNLLAELKLSLQEFEYCHSEFLKSLQLIEICLELLEANKTCQTLDRVQLLLEVFRLHSNLYLSDGGFYLNKSIQLLNLLNQPVE